MNDLWSVGGPLDLNGQTRHGEHGGQRRRREHAEQIPTLGELPLTLCALLIAAAGVFVMRGA